MKKMTQKEAQKIRDDLILLQEKENERMNTQNEEERKSEIGNNCFDTANIGSETLKKVLEKQLL